MEVDPQPFVLLIDNYDSFTYNIFQYLSELGAKVSVFRNDEVTVEECLELAPEYLVVSPGPGKPSEAGVSSDVIRAFAGKIPILGICLGYQCIYEIYGGSVVQSAEIVHGKTSAILHDGKGVFADIPDKFQATRYHSLIGDEATLPKCLQITSKTENGLIMGVRHVDYPMEGIQFHPESIVSEHGKQLLCNFLDMK